MAKHNLSWDKLVQMCRQAHPKDEQLVADAFQVEQLDLEAEAAEHAQGRERLAVARTEITDARAELAEVRAELTEARAAPPVAPPADAVIHDIADDDVVVPSHFECADDQRVLLASFESLAGDALRRQAWVAEEEAHSYVIAMARGYMCSDLDSLQRRVPSPAWVEQENRELADAITARDEAVVEAARDMARYHAQMAALRGRQRRWRRRRWPPLGQESPVGLLSAEALERRSGGRTRCRSPACAARGGREALALRRRRRPLRWPVVGRAMASSHCRPDPDATNAVTFRDSATSVETQT
ncbi:hypothetical protein QYE76_032354 [Lolium multiflorum]|uniref:Uncharacterized protein n=1 Tax=Lolium multiflorum TaxID=4521 RepID=A0AAD8QUX5_LOLMU|nr:hypothetical protein QYE76_032354 [Lolium multiflorum]